LNPQFEWSCFVNRLSTSRLAGWHSTQGVKTLRVKPERLASIRLCSRTMPCHVEGRERQCKTLQDCARSGKSFLASLRRVVQLVRTPACHAGGRWHSHFSPFWAPPSKNPTSRLAGCHCTWGFRGAVTLVTMLRELGPQKLRDPKNRSLHSCTAIPGPRALLPIAQEVARFDPVTAPCYLPLSQRYPQKTAFGSLPNAL
jgi:hypothetical protein